MKLSFFIATHKFATCLLVSIKRVFIFTISTSLSFRFFFYIFAWIFSRFCQLFFCFGLILPCLEFCVCYSFSSLSKFEFIRIVCVAFNIVQLTENESDSSFYFLFRSWSLYHFPISYWWQLSIFICFCCCFYTQKVFFCWFFIGKILATESINEQSKRELFISFIGDNT